MKTRAMMIQVVPGDIVYIVLSVKTKVVMKAEISKVVLDRNSILYFIDKGKIVCEKGSKEFNVGQEIFLLHTFCNSNLDTGVGIGNNKNIFVFSRKDKCLEFLRGNAN